MEELSEHMSLHLKEHLGDADAMEELGEPPLSSSHRSLRGVEWSGVPYP